MTSGDSIYSKPTVKINVPGSRYWLTPSVTLTVQGHSEFIVR